jgi:hypothetical protein
MIVRAGSGWQTLMADLSIILFMVTAAALSQTKDGVAAPAPKPSARAEPLAVYRNGPGAPTLSQWLAAQSPDPRQQLSIVAHYPPGGQQAALAEAAQLLSQAGAAGISARLVVEPGEGGVVAILAYDAPVAQPLLSSPQTPKSPETK